MRQSLMLLGRSGSGKTSVMETLSGSKVKNARDVQSFIRFGLDIEAKETFGFFSNEHNMEACTQDLEDCVRSFPGIDVIGFVIRLGRFTPEEKEMIDIFRNTLGELAFDFTIVIFTNLDNLIYDNVPLSEFLEDSPHELHDLLSLCGGRYVGFNNTGSEEDREGYARSLIEAMESLQKKNTSAKYTVDLLQQARNAKLVKDQEKKKVEEENLRLLKEQMKHDIRSEVEAKVRQELDRQIAQDIAARQSTEDCEKKQQGGDRRKLEDVMFGEDQGRRKPDGMRCGEDQGRRKPDGMRCGEDQGRRQRDGMGCGEGQGRRKPDGIQYGEDLGRKPEGMRCCEDQGRRKLDGIPYAEDEARRKPEERRCLKDQMRRKQSTEDHGMRELEDKRCDGHIEKPAGGEGAQKGGNKKPKPKPKPKPNYLKEKRQEKNEKLADLKEDSERTRPRNSMPRRIFETLTQAWRSVTGKM